MSIEKLRLIDFLRLSVDAGEIPSRFPIEQIVEACTEGQPEQVAQDFQCLIQRNAYGQGSIDVLTLAHNGLFHVGELNSSHVTYWPEKLRLWLRLVQAAKRRNESARQADDAALALAVEEKRLALVKEAAKQIEESEAKADQRRVDEWSECLAVREKDGNDRQAKSQDELAMRVAVRIEKLMGDQESIPLTPKKSGEERPITVAVDSEGEIDLGGPIRRLVLRSTYEFFDDRLKETVCFDVWFPKLQKEGSLEKRGPKGYLVREVQNALQTSKWPHVIFRSIPLRATVAEDLLSWGARPLRA